MRSRFGPYFLLTILAVLLFFILGVRYGQRVEKENKKINYILSLTPTKSPTPTKEASPSAIPSGFKKFLDKECGVEFLYPESALFSFSCEKTASQ